MRVPCSLMDKLLGWRLQIASLPPPNTGKQGIPQGHTCVTWTPSIWGHGRRRLWTECLCPSHTEALITEVRAPLSGQHPAMPALDLRPSASSCCSSHPVLCSAAWALQDGRQWVRSALRLGLWVHHQGIVIHLVTTNLTSGKKSTSGVWSWPAHHRSKMGMKARLTLSPSSPHTAAASPQGPP